LFLVDDYLQKSVAQQTDYRYLKCGINPPCKIRQAKMCDMNNWWRGCASLWKFFYILNKSVISWCILCTVYVHVCCQQIEQIW